jgi:hypothetical protein
MIVKALVTIRFIATSLREDVLQAHRLLLSGAKWPSQLGSCRLI